MRSRVRSRGGVLSSCVFPCSPLGIFLCLFRSSRILWRGRSSSSSYLRCWRCAYAASMPFEVGRGFVQQVGERGLSLQARPVALAGRGPNGSSLASLCVSRRRGLWEGVSSSCALYASCLHRRSTPECRFLPDTVRGGLLTSQRGKVRQESCSASVLASLAPRRVSRRRAD